MKLHYEIIKDNRDAFIALKLSGWSGPQQSEKEEIKKTVEKAFDGLTEDEANNLRRLITILFPRQNNSIYGSEWDKRWAVEKRIASDKYFDRYFTYSIPIGDVSDIRIENFINALNDIEPKELINTLTKELTAQNAEVFIAKLQQKIDMIPNAGKEKLAICISLFGSRLPNPKELFSFSSPFSRGALLIAYLIEAQVNEEQRHNLAVNVINIAEPITFATEIIRWLRRKETDESALSAEGLQDVANTLANRIEVLALQGLDFFEEYSDQAPHLFWFWGKFGSKENADKYISDYLIADIRNVHRLLDSVVPIAYPMDGSPSHKSEFERSQYNSLQSFVDLNLVYDLLKTNFGDKLESEQYPQDFREVSELQYAKQFAWIHKYVLNEQQNTENKNQDQEKPETDLDKQE